MDSANLSSKAVIIVDLDAYGRICDFNIELQHDVEVCDKSEPTRTKLGLELNPSTLTKTFNCVSCDAVLSFNMIVRTSRVPRKSRNKRKAHSEVIETELQRMKKEQKTGYENVFEKESESTSPIIQNEEHQKEIPQIVQEEIIIENTADTLVVCQCPIEACSQLFESMEEWQKHYLLQHQTELNPVKAATPTTNQINPEVTDDLLVLETNDPVTKCTSCNEPISHLHDQMMMCYFCSYQENQRSSNPINHPVYRCPVCKNSFDTHKTLADHMRVSCKIKWLHCDICSFITVSEDELNKHKENTHNVTL